jgi:hypothetical protein
MRILTMVAALGAAGALGGCDRLAGLAGGDSAGNETVQGTGEVGPSQMAAADATRATSAGLTSSRSLAGLTSAGGKDPTAIPAGSGAVIAPQRLVGRWADDEGCKQDVTLRGDGTFVSHTGGEGTWSVNGDVLSLTGAEGTFSVQVQSIEGDIMTMINADGSIGRSRRC